MQRVRRIDDQQSGGGEGRRRRLRRDAEFETQTFSRRFCCGCEPRHCLRQRCRWRAGSWPDTRLHRCRSAISRKPPRRPSPSLSNSSFASNGGSISTSPRRSFGGTKAGSADPAVEIDHAGLFVAAQHTDQRLARLRLELAGDEAVLRPQQRRARSAAIPDRP